MLNFSFFNLPYRVYKKIKNILRKKNQNHSFAIFGEFVDSFGVSHKLLKGYRDNVQPGWRNALIEPDYTVMPSVQEINKKLNKARTIVDSVEKQLNGFSFSLQGKKILEFGCHDGAKLHQFINKGVSKAVGSDIPYYYKLERTSDSKEIIQKEQKKYLKYIRGQTCSSPEVIFEEDNITNSKFQDNSFDLVFSWNVLEHVQKPDRALLEINRILTKRGISFSKYNPFFCEGGGHSLCTLDFPWGHVRLSKADYFRYLIENRESEQIMAEDFYKYSLNRMTINDFKAYSEKSGMEVLAILPWVNNDHMFKLTHEIITESKRNHNSLEELDLISPGVITILRKL